MKTMFSVNFRMGFNASVLVEAESEEDAIAAVYTNGYQDAIVDYSYAKQPRNWQRDRVVNSNLNPDLLETYLEPDVDAAMPFAKTLLRDHLKMAA